MTNSSRFHFSFLFPLLFLGFSSIYSQQQDTVRVLFIGNSYTYANDLPIVFRELARAAGRKVLVDDSTPGGFSLEQHLNYKLTVDKILERRWDYVILQEQSVTPLIPYYREHSMYPAARRLDSLVKSVGGKTVFFLTWARKFGGQYTYGSYTSPLFKDFFQMQDTITMAYRRIASELSSIVCPVGLAWKLAFRANPAAPLWDNGDKSHPFPEGTYLAACTFYSTIFGASPEGIPYTAPEVSSAAASYYQALGSHATLVYGEVGPRCRLWQNFPNPFARMTTVTFSIPQSGFATVKLFSINGREVATVASGLREAGTYDIYFDRRTLASGVYFYRLQFGGEYETMKMIVLK
jgi:hypothetical protein